MNFSLTTLAQCAGRNLQEGKAKQRFFVAQPGGSFVVAHSVALASSPSSHVCRVSPGSAPAFAPFEICGEAEILSRVTKRFASVDAAAAAAPADVADAAASSSHHRQAGRIQDLRD
jgi:hypothetical protein